MSVLHTLEQRRTIHVLLIKVGASIIYYAFLCLPLFRIFYVNHNQVLESISYRFLMVNKNIKQLV